MQHQRGRRFIVLEHRNGRRDGNFFPTVRALIGYFEFSWHLTVTLFPAKISELATLQSLCRQRVTAVTREC